jgi:hypothetical protein
MSPTALLVEGARLHCRHRSGAVRLQVTQDLVFVGGRALHLQPDPEHRPIVRCASTGPTIRPCQTTDVVRSGYLDWVRVAGRPVCTAAVVGRTDGDPIGTIDYSVTDPAQDWVVAP